MPDRHLREQVRAAVRVSAQGKARRLHPDLRRDRGHPRLRAAAQRPPRRMVGRRHAGASARSGPGDPPGRIRLPADRRGRTGALPEAVDPAPPPADGRHPISPSWCFPARRPCRCTRRRRSGFFERRGLAVELKAAPNSAEQRAGLAAGRYQIVHGAADQCVALVEAKVDAVVVAGGDNGFNHLFVQPDIARLEDLRGRTLAADVADTGWSFVLYDILKRHGLSRGDYAIHEAGAPFRRFAAMRDDKHRGGDPQSAVRDPRPPRRAEGHGRRGRQHRALSRHRALCAAGVGAGQRGDAGGLSRRLHRGAALGPRSGEPGGGDRALCRAARRPGRYRDGDVRCGEPTRRTAWPRMPPSTAEGFETVLRLRADFEGRTPAPPEQYFDLSFHQRALAGL